MPRGQSQSVNIHSVPHPWSNTHRNRWNGIHKTKIYLRVQLSTQRLDLKTTNLKFSYKFDINFFRSVSNTYLYDKVNAINALDIQYVNLM